MKRRMILILSSVASSAILLLSTGRDASALTTCPFNDPNGYSFCVDSNNDYDCSWAGNAGWCDAKLPTSARSVCRTAVYACEAEYSNGLCYPDYPVWGYSVTCVYEDK